MAKKKTPEEKWRRLEKIFDPTVCTFSFSRFVADGIAKEIKHFDREMFDREIEGGEVLKGKIIAQNGPLIQVIVEGEIINIELA